MSPAAASPPGHAELTPIGVSELRAVVQEAVRGAVSLLALTNLVLFRLDVGAEVGPHEFRALRGHLRRTRRVLDNVDALAERWAVMPTSAERVQ